MLSTAAPLDPDVAYLALRSRDPRFDGRLFVGVTSTGIYCRPICRVRTPLRRNCRFFQTPAQAEACAFRPCLKCRPEIAPGAGPAWTVMDASRTLAQQAAYALDAMVASDDTPSVARLAQRLGISDRHLRRIFLAEHGVTPLQHLQTRRLLLAKQLLTDSRMPVSQVALASGFASLRRFNAAFAQAYRMSPSRLRGGELAREAGDGAIQVTLSYRAPLDRDSLLRFLARRAVPGVEAIVGARVRRSVRAQVLAPDAGWLEVEFTARPEVATPAPAGKIQLRFAPAWARSSAAVVAAVRRWLDLDAEPVAIDSTLADLPGAPGLRLPGSLDGFEAAVRAILGQQVTVAAARTLAARLVDRFGLPLSSPWPELSRCFPAPAALASLAPATLSELGVMPARSAALIALARVWPDIEARIRSQCPGELITHLRSLPGIGPWTAQYIAMRVLSWPDAFPPGDVAALQAMRRLFGDMTPGQAQRRAQDWQPWRSYAVLRLWNSLDQEHP